MSYKIFMNVSDGDECRIAMVKDGLLHEYLVDRPSQLKYVGDIYRAVVSNVEPSIQAAFINVGHKKNAFLHVSDVLPTYKSNSSLVQIFGDRPVEVTSVEDIDFSAIAEEVDRQPEADDDDDSADEEGHGAEHAEDSSASGRLRAVESTGSVEEVRPVEGQPIQPFTRSATEEAMRDTASIAQSLSEPSDLHAGNGASATSGAAQGLDTSASSGDASFAGDSTSESTDQRKKTGHKRTTAAGKTPTARVRKPRSTTRKKTATVTESTATADAADEAATPKTTRRASRAKATPTRPATARSRKPRGSTRRASGEQPGGGRGIAGADTWNDGMQEPGKLGERGPLRFRREAPPQLQGVLHRGREVLVQVIRAALGTKGPSVTTYVSLPGRYMVLMPHTSKCGISRKITDVALRRQLRRSLKMLRVPQGMGVVIRTAAAGRKIEELQRDLNYLLRLWNSILESINSDDRPPRCVYRDNDPILRTIRDNFTEDVTEVVIDDRAEYERVLAFFDDLMPDYRDRVKLYEGEVPLFTREGLEPQIEHIFDMKVPLPSGGYLFIEQTEALVAIDVNSGRFTSESSSEETAFRTNMEAVPEIARQLKLRDLGGIIVGDFIDMEDVRHRRAVEDRLKTCLRQDRARVKVAATSPFGLIEMTRQRVRPSIRSYTYQDCDACKGFGNIRNPETQSLNLLRAIRLLLSHPASHGAVVQAPPGVLSFLHSRLRAELQDIEKRTGKSIVFEYVPSLLSDEFKLYYINDRGDRSSWDHEAEVNKYAVHRPHAASSHGNATRGGRRRRGGRGERGDRSEHRGHDGHRNDRGPNHRQQGSASHGDQAQDAHDRTHSHEREGASHESHRHAGLSDDGHAATDQEGSGQPSADTPRDEHPRAERAPEGDRSFSSDAPRDSHGMQRRGRRRGGRGRGRNRDAHGSDRHRMTAPSSDRPSMPQADRTGDMPGRQHDAVDAGSLAQRDGRFEGQAEAERAHAPHPREEHAEGQHAEPGNADPASAHAPAAHDHDASLQGHASGTGEGGPRPDGQRRRRGRRGGRRRRGRHGRGGPGGGIANGGGTSGPSDSGGAGGGNV